MAVASLGPVVATALGGPREQSDIMFEKLSSLQARVLDSDSSKKGMELRRCKKQNSKEHKIVFSHNFLTSGQILVKF